MRKACPFWSCAPPLTHHRGGALDRLENADMRAATTFQALERLLDLGFARLLLLGEQRCSGHDPAVDAVAALRHLFLDVGGLQRMRLVRSAETSERHPLVARGVRNRRDAGADRLPVKMHRAGAALRQAAAEVRIVQA